jgi:hypothetical protein
MVSRNDKLRDRYAGLAMQALIIGNAIPTPVEGTIGEEQMWCSLRYRRVSDLVKQPGGSTSTYAEMVAREAYTYADAMLNERANSGPRSNTPV